MAPHLQSLLSTMSECPDASQQSAWTPEELPAPRLCLPRPDDHGHYSSPGLDRLRWALEQHHLETLQHLSQQTQERLELLKLSLEKGLDQGDDPLHQQILAATLQFQMALKMALLYLETHQPQWRHSALDLAQTATDQMAIAYLAFLEHAQACLTVYCPGCSGANPRGQQRCSHCTQVLPQSIQLEANPRFEAADCQNTTPNHDRLVSAVEGYQKGLLTAPAMRQELTEVWQNMHRHLRSLDKDRRQSQRLPSQQRAAYDQVLDAVEAALDASLAAVEELLLFFDGENSVHLEHGLELLQVATPCLLDAFQALQNLGAELAE